jgi:hypothetical protein
MGEPFEGRLVRETPNRVATAIRSTWLGVTWVLIPVYGLGFGHLPLEVLAAIGVGWIPLTVAMIPIMRHFAKKPERRSVNVRIDDDGIHVDDKLLVRRRRIRSGGTYVAKDGGARVVFQPRCTLASFFTNPTPPVVFFADHLVQAEHLLAAAGVDIERQVFRATFLRPHAAWPVVMALFVYVGLSDAIFKTCRSLFELGSNPMLAMIPVLIAGAIAFGLYALAARTTVTVGNDGVEVRRALRRRFVRLDEIRHVKAESNVLAITLVTGERLAIAHASPIGEPVGNFGASDIDMERGLLADRIADALRIHKRRMNRHGAVLALGRASRSPGEWWAALQAIGMGASDYRTTDLPVEALHRVVTDTTAPSDVRVGAAIALRVSGRSEGAERIRIAADATAAPELRRLLNDIAEERDGDLQRHLARLG